MSNVLLGFVLGVIASVVALELSSAFPHTSLVNHLEPKQESSYKEETLEVSQAKLYLRRALTGPGYSKLINSGCLTPVVDAILEGDWWHPGCAETYKHLLNPAFIEKRRKQWLANVT